MKRKDEGYLLVGILFITCVFSTLFLVYNKVWATVGIREREKELIFNLVSLQRGIDLYKKEKNDFPDNLEILWESKLIRKKYRNPFRSRLHSKWEEDWNYDNEKGIIKPLSRKKGLNGKEYKEWQVEYKKGNKYSLTNG